jgi:hypothetical protein
MVFDNVSIHNTKLKTGKIVLLLNPNKLSFLWSTSGIWLLKCFQDLPKVWRTTMNRKKFWIFKQNHKTKQNLSFGRRRANNYQGLVFKCSFSISKWILLKVQMNESEFYLNSISEFFINSRFNVRKFQI